jgi:hypothetical protein
VSKTYHHIKGKTGVDPSAGAYPGTILDFLLDRLACGVKIGTIQADYRLIWHTDISEDDIIEIIKGHEHELPLRRQQAAEVIRKSNLLTMYLDAIRECYESLKDARNPREKVNYLNALHGYLSIYVKSAEQKDFTVGSEVSPDAVISLLNGIMGVGDNSGTGKRKRER